MHDIDEMIYADPIDCKEHSTKWVKIIHKISSYAGIVKNATNRFACPWVEDFSPVDGWVVKKSKRRYNLNDYESFEIIECPLFERG